ncbi:MAG: ABC transporter substrate-binding protein [Actinomycetes bacterium]
MSRPRRLLPVLLVSLIAVVGLMAAPAIADSASPSPTGTVAPTVLRVGMTSGIDNPNIFAVTSVAEWQAVVMQYDMLMRFGDKDLTAVPSLATGCDANADRTVWTCHIQPGLKWSDGKPLTSKDVAFSYKFVMDKQFDYFSGYFPEGTTFQTPDDLTLVWKSPTPTNGPTVPAWSYVVPEHIWGKYADADAKTIRAASTLPNVGSGPYVMTAANPGQNWTFSRNPNFWGPKPAYDTIEFQLFTNQDAMVQALKNGQIDIADGIEGALLPAVSALPNVAVQKVVADSWINLAFNFGGRPTAKALPALQDIRVRKAIEMAIDKQQIVDKVYPGAASPGETIIRPLSAFWHLTVPKDKVIAYDPAAANAMLDQAGYTMGPDGVRIDPKTDQPLKIRMPVSDDTPGSTQAGQLVASFLKKIGIAVTVQPVTAGKMYDIQQAGDFDAYIWYWSGDPDPNYQLSAFDSSACPGLSDGCWKDPTYDAMFAKQQATLDPAARKVIVDQMQQYVYDQVPNIVLIYPETIEAYRTDKVAGLTPVPEGNGYLMPSYVYTSMVNAHPVQADTGSTTTTTSPSGSSGIPPWVWAVVAVVVIALGVLMVRRRRGEADREELD